MSGYRHFGTLTAGCSSDSGAIAVRRARICGRSGRAQICETAGAQSARHAANASAIDFDLRWRCVIPDQALMRESLDADSMRLTACLAMCEPVVMWISKNLRPHAAMNWPRRSVQ